MNVLRERPCVGCAVGPARRVGCASTSRGFSRHPARFPSVPRGHGGRRPRRRGGHRILAEARIPGYIAPPHERPIPVTLLARLATVGVALLAVPACGARSSLRDELAADRDAVDAPTATHPPSTPPPRSTCLRLPDVPSIPRCSVRRPMSPSCRMCRSNGHRSARGGRLAHLRAALVGGRALLGLQPRRAARRRHHGTSRRPEPRVVAGVSDAVSIAAGEEHTCAVRRDGAVLCWGLGTHGELGDGRQLSRATPGPVRGLNEAVQVAGGHNHTCARLRSGQVSCWGGNTSGELGDDAPGNDRPCRWRPSASPTRCRSSRASRTRARG
jgi:hypothetical protein